MVDLEEQMYSVQNKVPPEVHTIVSREKHPFLSLRAAPRRPHCHIVRLVQSTQWYSGDRGQSLRRLTSIILSAR